MNVIEKPNYKPNNPNFSSGPCAKRPGWDVKHLSSAPLGRSHRSKPCKSKINEVCELSRSILKLPESYHIAIVPGSDTGAIEMAMWSMLGERPIDILSWESFGEGWVTDVVKQLKLSNVKKVSADYGQIPALETVDCDKDVIFTWNGTTSGVCVSNADWIKSDRKGLTFCDATSAVFAMDLDWSKLDVTTYSWQKVLGGEAQHGMLILSPRAVERLEAYSPPWPLPKLFRLTKNGNFNASIFSGATINTVSMLCVEDVLDSLYWVNDLGGQKELVRRSKENLRTIEEWVMKTDWVEFLCENKNNRSSTSICLSIVDESFKNLENDQKDKFSKFMVNILDEEQVAYDIGSYRDAPPGLRIWGGATVESSDIKLLCPWLDWAFYQAKENIIGR